MHFETGQEPNMKGLQALFAPQAKDPWSKSFKFSACFIVQTFVVLQLSYMQIADVIRVHENGNWLSMAYFIKMTQQWTKMTYEPWTWPIY